jgi:hypothetical protein
MSERIEVHGRFGLVTYFDAHHEPCAVDKAVSGEIVFDDGVFMMIDVDPPSGAGR